MRLWPRRKVYIDDLPKTHDLRFGLIFVVGVAVVIGALYGVGYLVAGNKLPAGTKVAEVDVGGMSPDRARTVLQEKLAPRLEDPIKVNAGGKTYSIDPQLAGLTFDIDATLDQALGGSAWDPRHMLHVLTGGDTLDPVVDLDSAELVSSLSKVATQVERKPVDSRVSFRRVQPKVFYGRAGRALDYQRSGERLKEAIIAGDDRVNLAVDTIQPHVTVMGATTFEETVARKAVSGPIRIKVADSVMTLTPRQFGPALQALPGTQGLRLSVDQAKLVKRASPAMKKLPHHPVNARISFRGDRPVIVPGRSGVTVGAGDLAKAVLKAVDSRGAKRVARAEPTADNPDVSTEDLRVMRINQQISATQVRFKAGDRADPTAVLRRLDGALVQPGQTFSFLRHVGANASPAASFVASMAYDAAFYAGLDIPVHTNARIYSDTFAPGFDAHVEPPGTDLVLANGSPYGVYVRSYVERPGRQGSSARIAHVEMWSTPYWTVRALTSGRYNVVQPQVITNTRPSCVPRDGVTGFEYDVTRVLKEGGHKRTERTHAAYVPLDQVRCR